MLQAVLFSVKLKRFSWWEVGLVCRGEKRGGEER